jgi:hypothetical protein
VDASPWQVGHERLQHRGAFRAAIAAGGLVMVAISLAGLIGSRHDRAVLPTAITVLNHGTAPVIVQVYAAGPDGWRVHPGHAGPGVGAPPGTKVWIYTEQCALITTDSAEGGASPGIIEIEADGHVGHVYAGDAGPPEYSPGHGCPLPSVVPFHA